MLPNDVVDYIVLRNLGEDREGFGNQLGLGMGKKGDQVEMEAQFNSESTTSAFRTRLH